MSEQNSSNLSESAKVAIAGYANQWSLETYNALERLRRNLLISCLFGLFVGLAGIKPQRIAFLGNDLGEGPWWTFYAIALFINAYLYWSYYTRTVTMDLHRNFRAKIYKEFFDFEYFPSLLEQRKIFDVWSYRLYTNIIPTIAAGLSMSTVIGRILIDLST